MATHEGPCPKRVAQEQRWKELRKQWGRQHDRGRRPNPVAIARRRELKRDGGRCAKCGDTKHLEVDHVKAIRDGGLDVRSNLQILCRPCHKAKSKKEWIDGRHERMRQASGIAHFKR